MEQTARRLSRDTDQGVIAGVAAGWANYLRLDPAIIRVAFVVLAIAGGSGLVLYVVSWVLMPAGVAPSSPAVPNREHRDATATIATGLVVVGGILLLREVGVWFADQLIWPAVLMAVGLALIWRHNGGPGRVPLAGVVEQIRTDGWKKASRRALALDDSGIGWQRAAVVRVILGVVLAGASIWVFLAEFGSFDAAFSGVLAGVVLVVGLGLLFAPWWWRLATELADERRARIRSQERSEMAAHLHDSVLHTLALIQRSSEEPEQMVRLARRQERELRLWLFEDQTERPSDSLAAAIEAVAADVEDLHDIEVEVVTVGDCDTDQRLAAMVQAVREALVNAARWAEVDRVSVFLEIGDDTATAFVRDRGVGFSRGDVPRDRRGIAESIEGRMARHDGTATIRSEPGAGTEVELTMDRRP